MKEPYDVYQGGITTVEDVSDATMALGHERNPTLKATESTEGFLEAFFSVARNGGSPLAIGEYVDVDAPALPANAIPLEVLVSVVETKAGAGALAVRLGSTNLVASVTTVGASQVATPGALKNAAARAVNFLVTAGTLTAGAVRVRIRYLRG